MENEKLLSESYSKIDMFQASHEAKNVLLHTWASSVHELKGKCSSIASERNAAMASLTKRIERVEAEVAQTIATSEEKLQRTTAYVHELQELVEELEDLLTASAYTLSSFALYITEAGRSPDIGR